jgi:transposase-like protein
MSISRRKFGKDFKSKVVLESIKERESLEVLAKRYELLPTQISMWKSLALSKFSSLFSNEAIVAKKDLVDVQTLYAQIGQLKVENDFLKKKLL